MEFVLQNKLIELDQIEQEKIRLDAEIRNGAAIALANRAV